MNQKLLKNGFRKILGQLRNWVLSKLTLQAHLSSGITIKIENDADWIIYNDIFVDREYDLAIQQVIKSEPEHQSLNFLDIGANVGFFTLRVADLIRRSENPQMNFEVVLVEGSPSIYQKLKSRLMPDSVLSNKLRICHGLVGKRQGTGKIFESAFHITNSTIDNGKEQGIEVPYIDLMELYSGDRQIDLLKCDIEGAEEIFIENYQELLLNQVKSAIFELHPDKCNTARCIKLLKELGFVNHQKLREAPMFSVDFFWK